MALVNFRGIVNWEERLDVGLDDTNSVEKERSTFLMMLPFLASVFLFAYVLILCVCAAIVSLDGVGLETSLSAALTTISNVGPGFALVGPTCNFSFMTALSKIVLTLTMLLGRLEIMPLLVLLVPGAWKRK